jgi:3'-phosphoadenosine 5'-phosphosulfate sulfotransferase (PAPS reductase)/FAD synthetase
VTEVMKMYQICVRCVMDISDPEIRFDANGFCNHCTQAIALTDYLKHRDESSLTALTRIEEQVSQKPGVEGFHALIGVSGGVDSSYLLHLMSKTNLKLLAVHVDAGWNSLESVRNINNMVSKLGIELETIVIDWEEMKNL